MADKVEGIVKTTQKNALLGFLKASLIAIGILGTVIGYLYLDQRKVNKERLDALRECDKENKSLEAEFRAYIIQENRRKETGIQNKDSIISEIKK